MYEFSLTQWNAFSGFVGKFYLLVKGIETYRTELFNDERMCCVYEVWRRAPSENYEPGQMQNIRGRALQDPE